MMGSAKSNLGFGSLLELVDLLEDKEKYTATIQVLDSKIKHAETVLAQANENNKSAEERRALAQRMLDQASQKATEANEAKARAESLATDVSRREGLLSARTTAHEASVAEAQTTLEGVKRQHAEAVAQGTQGLEEQRRAFMGQMASAHADLDKRKQALVDQDASLKQAAVKLEADRAELQSQRDQFIQDQAAHNDTVEQLRKLLPK